MTNNDIKTAARIKFMLKLQALDLDDLDAGLAAMSVEAANLFPMINDTIADANTGPAAAERKGLLERSIYRVEGEGSNPAPKLTLEQNILIDAEGNIIDGRNRTAAIIRNFGLPVFDYVEGEENEGARYMATIREKRGAMDMLKQAAKDETVEPAKWNDADLLFRALDVDLNGSALDTVINRNMARRDMTTSQRACVAANVSAAGFKRMVGSKAKVTDAMIADNFGIGHKTMKRAKALKKSHKDLFDQCLNGKLSVGGAEQIAVKRATEAAGGKEAAPAPKQKKENAQTGVTGSVTTLTFDQNAVRDGIANAEVDSGDLYDAIMEGLEARLGKVDLTELEGPLAKLLDVKLA